MYISQCTALHSGDDRSISIHSCYVTGTVSRYVESYSRPATAALYGDSQIASNSESNLPPASRTTRHTIFWISFVNKQKRPNLCSLNSRYLSGFWNLYNVKNCGLEKSMFVELRKRLKLDALRNFSVLWIFQTWKNNISIIYQTQRFLAVYLNHMKNRAIIYRYNYW